MPRKDSGETENLGGQRMSTDARVAALLGPAAVAAVEDIVAASMRELPLDSGPLRHELQVLLRPHLPRRQQQAHPSSPASAPGDAA